MAFDLSDRYETSDGSRPDSTALPVYRTADLPLAAFTVLSGGDVFETSSRTTAGEREARTYVCEQIAIDSHGAPAPQVRRAANDIARQLGSNPNLIGRMKLARSIAIDLVPPGGALVALGFPRTAIEKAAGFFWDRPEWKSARIALRQEELEHDPTLVFHEMAHAIFYLGFTVHEQKQIYDLLQPTFGSRAAMDEVFAIYSERELAGEFRESEKRAPGVYGFARRQWSEDHAFTRFVRKLYFPQRPAAGPGMRPVTDGDWMRKISR